MAADAKMQAIRERAKAEFRLTTHAADAMDDEGFTVADVRAGIASGSIIEDYPDDQRGAACLVNGKTGVGRGIHVVCTSGDPLVIVTVYKPLPPKWPTPTQRRAKP